MDDIREIPCPNCGDPMPFQVDQLQPANIYFCEACRGILVVTEALTLRRATNVDLCAKPIGTQMVVIAFQRGIRGMKLDVYC